MVAPLTLADLLVLPVQKMKPLHDMQARDWSEAEDQLLVALVQQETDPDFAQLSQHFNDRTPQDCRLRWDYHLSPFLKQYVLAGFHLHL